MSLIRVVALGLFIALLTASGAVDRLAAQGGQSAEALMGAAQHAQDVDGDLDAALAGYQKVVAHASASRSLKATALLRMGRLYEKKGAQEARRTYERIAREYADQPAVVAEARSRLAALNPSGTTAEDTQVVARQVWAGRDTDPFGSVGQDGRSYAFVDWNATPTGNLAIRDLVSGETRLLTNFRTAAEGFAENPSWSADSRRIAYVWSGADAQPAELRIIGQDGAGARVAFARQDAYPSTPNWSPDGRWLGFVVTTYGATATSDLVVIEAESGRQVTTRSFGSITPLLGGFSPDSRRLAYSLGGPSGSQDSSVRMLDVAANQETTLASGPGRYSTLAWTPDGSSLVVLSDRSGEHGLWRIETSEKRSSAQPQMLKANVGDLWRLHVGRDGAIWYGVVNAVSDVYTTEFDAAALTTRSAPVRLSDRFIGSTSGAAWSPDGRSMAFMRGTDRRKRTVIVRTLADGREKELPAPFTDTIHASNWGPTWLADSNALLVADFNYAEDRFTVHQLGVASGKVDVALDGEFRRAWPLVRVSPDGRHMYFTRRVPEPSIDRSTLVLVRRDRDTGQETELYRAPSLGAVGFFGLALSPDGNAIAFSQNVGEDQRHVMLLAATGGTPRVLYRGRYSMPQPQSGAFTQDGRYVLVTGQDRSAGGSGASNKVWAIPVDGGAPRFAGLERRGMIGNVQVSPDGTRLAFTGTERTGELWTMRNLLPPATKNAAR